MSRAELQEMHAGDVKVPETGCYMLDLFMVSSVLMCPYHVLQVVPDSGVHAASADAFASAFNTFQPSQPVSTKYIVCKLLYLNCHFNSKLLYTYMNFLNL